MIIRYNKNPGVDWRTDVNGLDGCGRTRFAEPFENSARRSWQGRTGCIHICTVQRWSACFCWRYRCGFWTNLGSLWLVVCDERGMILGWFCKTFVDHSLTQKLLVKIKIEILFVFNTTWLFFYYRYLSHIVYPLIYLPVIVIKNLHPYVYFQKQYF